MTKKSNIFQKNLVGIDLVGSKTCFKTKISILENISPWTFLVRAPDSSNASVAAARGGTASSFGEHAPMGKGTYNYDGSKELH